MTRAKSRVGGLTDGVPRCPTPAPGPPCCVRSLAGPVGKAGPRLAWPGPLVGPVAAAASWRGPEARVVTWPCCPATPRWAGCSPSPAACPECASGAWSGRRVAGEAEIPKKERVDAQKRPALHLHFGERLVGHGVPLGCGVPMGHVFPTPAVRPWGSWPCASLLPAVAAAAPVM